MGPNSVQNLRLESGETQMKQPDITGEAAAFYRLSRQYAVINKKDSSIDFLYKGMTLNKIYIGRAKADRHFDNIRSSPEFQTLINSFG